MLRHDWGKIYLLRNTYSKDLGPLHIITLNLAKNLKWTCIVLITHRSKYITGVDEAWAAHTRSFWEVNPDLSPGWTSQCLQRNKDKFIIYVNPSNRKVVSYNFLRKDIPAFKLLTTICSFKLLVHSLEK